MEINTQKYVRVENEYCKIASFDFIYHLEGKIFLVNGKKIMNCFQFESE